MPRFNPGNPADLNLSADAATLSYGDVDLVVSKTGVAIDGSSVIVANGGLVADATTDVDVITRFNELLALLRTSTFLGTA